MAKNRRRALAAHRKKRTSSGKKNPHGRKRRYEVNRQHPGSKQYILYHIFPVLKRVG